MEKRIKLLALIALILSTLSCATTVGRVLKDYGFSEFRPPSTLLAPGTVIYVTRTRPTEGVTVCSPEEALGHSVKVAKSHTIAKEIEHKLSESLQISAEYLKRLKVDPKFSRIRAIRLQFSDVQILEISLATVHENLKNMSAGCRAAIQNQPGSVTMVTRALQADVTYLLEFTNEASLSAETREGLVRDIAAALNGKVQGDGTNKIVGADLLWGIIVSPHSIDRGAIDLLDRAININCTSGGQVCDKSFEVSIIAPSDGVLTLRYDVPGSHCSPFQFQLFLDGTHIGDSGVLGWHGNREFGSLSAEISREVTKGQHALKLTGEGIMGGCNTKGQLLSHQGRVKLTFKPKSM